MRFTLAILLASAAASASASLITRQTVPACALTCIGSANTGSCSATDNACLCNDQAFISSTTQCIQTTCSGSDVAAAESFAQATCAAVGVTLSSAAPASSGSASGSASGSGSATSSGTSGSPTSSASSSAASTSSSSAAKATGIPVFAAAALGLAAFAL